MNKDAALRRDQQLFHHVDRRQMNLKDQILWNVELQYIQLNHADVLRLTKDLSPLQALYRAHNVPPFEGAPLAQHFAALSREQLIALKDAVRDLKSKLLQPSR